MPLYEHTFLARHNLTSQQATALTDEFTAILTEGGGQVLETEYWGLRSLAYRIRNNRKAHYAFLRIDAPAPAVQEMERRMRLNEDVLRLLTLRVEAHEEGPTAIMRAKARREARRPRGREAEEAEGGAPTEAAADTADSPGAKARSPGSEPATETPAEQAPGAADSPGAEAGSAGTGSEPATETAPAKTPGAADSPGVEAGSAGTDPEPATAETPAESPAPQKEDPS